MKTMDFPIAVLSSPTFVNASATVRGVVFSLILSFWERGKFDLPDKDCQLSIMAQCYSSQWYRIRERVKMALNEILPALKTVHAQRHTAALKRQAKARKAGLASGAKRQLGVQLNQRDNKPLANIILRDTPVAGVQNFPKSKNLAKNRFLFTD